MINWYICLIKLKVIKSNININQEAYLSHELKSKLSLSSHLFSICLAASLFEFTFSSLGHYEHKLSQLSISSGDSKINIIEK